MRASEKVIAHPSVSLVINRVTEQVTSYAKSQARWARRHQKVGFQGWTVLVRLHLKETEKAKVQPAKPSVGFTSRAIAGKGTTVPTYTRVENLGHRLLFQRSLKTG